VTHPRHARPSTRSRRRGPSTGPGRAPVDRRGAQNRAGRPIGRPGSPRGTGTTHRTLSTRPRAAGPLRPRPLPRHGATGDRGDVPGWVLVTLMTAGLVVALWAVAGPALAGVFETAIARVTSVG
jgi:hypothetical protein